MQDSHQTLSRPTNLGCMAILITKQDEQDGRVMNYGSLTDEVTNLFLFHLATTIFYNDLTKNYKIAPNTIDSYILQV